MKDSHSDFSMSGGRTSEKCIGVLSENESKSNFLWYVQWIYFSYSRWFYVFFFEVSEPWHWVCLCFTQSFWVKLFTILLFDFCSHNFQSSRFPTHEQVWVSVWCGLSNKLWVSVWCSLAHNDENFLSSERWAYRTHCLWLEDMLYYRQMRCMFWCGLSNKLLQHVFWLMAKFFPISPSYCTKAYSQKFIAISAFA